MVRLRQIAAAALLRRLAQGHGFHACDLRAGKIRQGFFLHVQEQQQQAPLRRHPFENSIRRIPMRFTICFLALLLMCKPAFAADALWYEGGTLQKATVADWKSATPANQLATSGDFIASLSAISDISQVKDQATL